MMPLRWAILAGASILAASALATLPAVARAQGTGVQPVPVPAVSVPPAGKGKPFRFSVEDIASHGYGEEEFFIEGTARSYAAASDLSRVTDGRWDAAPTGPTAPYKVRLIIRRPSDPAKFNGTVLVDWLNVSAGYDSDTFDTFEAPFMREGYAYVGVTAQAIGANHMKTWDAARYGSLVHPGDSYSYDIFSQAAKALRQGNPAPLGNLTAKVKNLIAWGGSQSGARLITYTNAINPTARVYEGIIPFIAAGGAPLTQSPQTEVQVPRGAAMRIRTDVPTPILYQISESEVIGAARGLHQQPDSPTFRAWEYAGTSHSNGPNRDYTFKRGQAHGVSTGMIPVCVDPLSNGISAFPTARAMVDAMRVWLDKGKAPAIAPRMELTIPDDATKPATIAYDPKDGMVKGGIRLPQIAVPVATYRAARPSGRQEHQACPAYGAMDPWNGDADPGDASAATDISPKPEPSLKALYGNEKTYVNKVEASARSLAAKGFIPAYDIQTYVEEAKKVKIR